MISREEIKQKVAEAKRLLKEINYESTATVDDLIAYYSADTFYEDLSLEKVLENIFLVVHELVEINEIKHQGLKITKDVIIKNHEKIYEAHLIATEKELEVAFRQGVIQHILNRKRDVESWLNDPYLPKHLVKKVEKILTMIDKYTMRKE